MAENDIMSATDGVSLEALISRAVNTDRKLPPVDQWDPPRLVDIDMEIRADGAWFHDGTPINREALVRLFSTVLRRDADGSTYLVTPVEKVAVRVEDSPFIGVEMSVTRRNGEPVLTFRTNVGDVVEAGRDNPLRFAIVGEKSELKPYLLVRGRLEALISRALTYDLIDLAAPEPIDGVDTLCVRSAGAVFPVMPMARLESMSQ